MQNVSMHSISGDMERGRLKNRGVPRSMGGDGGISDAEAARNDDIFKTTVGAAAFGIGWSTYGLKKTFEYGVCLILESQSLSDGGNLRRPRPPAPRSETKQMKNNKSNSGRKKYPIWLPKKYRKYYPW